jgi:four helix bundle protein
MATFTHFYDLPVYKTCRIFRKKISLTVKEHFPKSEEYHLKAQVLDSSRSITSNIAEGFGRFHHQENIQFCRLSRGSLTEPMEHLITAYDEEYINENKLKEFNIFYKKCLKELNSYIKYLKTAKENNQ